MKRYQEWSKREYSIRQRLVALVPAGILFLFILPILLIIASNVIDAWLQLPRFSMGAINIIVALIFIAAGMSLGLWSIQAQMEIGRGTPVPMMPTMSLVVQGPFVYCRNPMTLGTFIAYTGIGIWMGSFAALAIVLILTTILLIYVKLIEEKELEMRFGDAYLEYKQYTPFILPRLRRRS